MPSSRFLCVSVACITIIMFVAVNGFCSSYSPLLMDNAAGQSRDVSTGNEDDVDDTVRSVRRNCLQLHRKKHRLLSHGVKRPRKDKIIDAPEDGMVATLG